MCIKRTRFKAAVIFFSIVLASFSSDVLAKVNQDKLPREFKEAQVVEKLGSEVDLDGIIVKDETGEAKPLRAFFQPKKPVILTPIYFECPNLCNFLLNGFLDSLKEAKWSAGEEFTILSFSINENDTPKLASQKKANYLKAYSRPKAAAGWHFLTADKETIAKFMDQVGFGYRYDKNEKQFAHTSALIFLTPDGKVSRYLHGIQFSQRDFRLALLEASQGRIGKFIDQVLLFCFHYDPKKGSYSIYAMRVMQVAAALTFFVMSLSLLVFWKRQDRKRTI